MRALHALATVGVSLSCHSIAFGVDIPLSVLNGGPSSDSIPATNTDPVAFIVSPREVVNTGIPTNLPIADLYGNSLLVQDASDPTGSGVRNRSRAVLAAFDVNSANRPFLQVQAKLGFDPTVVDSYFVFLNADDAATISTVAELEVFMAQGTPFTDYRQVFVNNPGLSTGSGPGGDFIDADITRAQLSTGDVGFWTLEISHTNFEVGLLVLSDGDHAVPTEYFCMRQDPTRITPIDAHFRGDNRRIVIDANTQFVTDGGEAVASSDTDLAAITGAAFRVRLNGIGPLETLDNFLLTRLSTPRTISSVETAPDRPDRVILTLDAPMTDPDDIATMLFSTIGFSPSLTADAVYSFAGEVAVSHASTFQSMNRPAHCPGNGIDADVNDDDVIDFADLNAVLSSFGQAGSQPGDVNSDGVVNFEDLNAVLSAFGMSCE